MDQLAHASRPVAARPAIAKWSCDLVGLASGLLPLFDMACVVLATWLATRLLAAGFAPPGVSLANGNAEALTALGGTALLAAVAVYDPRFGTRASLGDLSALVSRYLGGFVLFVGAVLIIAFASRTLEVLPFRWVSLVFGLCLLLSATARLLLAQTIRVLERRGVLAEVIAIVGAGPLADRLIQHLRERRGERVRILGVFDDATFSPGERRPHNPPTGTIAELLEVGTTRPIDWIVVTLPCADEPRVTDLVQRLKALAAPIGLCPQTFGLALPAHGVDYVGDGIPVTLLANRPARRWSALIGSLDLLLPDWLVRRPGTPAPAVVVAFDACDTATFAGVAGRFDPDRFDYVVTPNVDHLIRLHEDASFRALYAAAAWVLLDSRFLAHLLRLTRGLRLPVCPGSDLVALLFDEVISADDPLVLVGGTPGQAAQLVARYGLRQLAHFNPPMGFIRDADAVEACLRFVEANSPFRFCLLALGSPQQEMIAQQLKARGIACGLALCVGAAIDFMTGEESRAPRWLRRSGLEWTFRLARSPGRLAGRYLVRGPRIFGLLRRTVFVLRPAAPRHAGQQERTALSGAVQTPGPARHDTSPHDNPVAEITIDELTVPRVAVTAKAGLRRSNPDGGRRPHPVGHPGRLRGRERDRIGPGAT
jgi:exopolysaccharide biosynthesis WecB/TagA/CpsF family protein